MLHVHMLWFPLPVKSFVEMVKYLLIQPETKGHYILSEHFHKILWKIILVSSMREVVTVKIQQYRIV